MSAIRTGLLAFLVTGSACGSVPEDDVPGDGGTDAPPPGTTLYRGTLATTPAVTFGGNGGTGMNFCNYTVTLSQVEIELAISTTGVITGGSSQALAVETVVASTVPPCTAGPGIPPNIHKFTFKSATPSGPGFMVVMDGAVTNQPTSILTITLTPATGAYNAASRWSRTGTFPILTWMVTSNLTLTVKP